jgi:hypothetical protein
MKNKIVMPLEGYDRNNFKLSFDKEFMKFHVNEVTGCIYCEIKAQLLQPMSDKSPINLNEVTFVEMAKTTCKPNDKFDVERGKRIAMTKAENRLNKRVVNYIRKKLNHIEFMAKAMTDFNNRLMKQCAHNVNYIESVSDVKHPNYKNDITPIKSGLTRYVK